MYFCGEAVNHKVKCFLVPPQTGLAVFIYVSSCFSKYKNCALKFKTTMEAESEPASLGRRSRRRKEHDEEEEILNHLDGVSNQVNYFTETERFQFHTVTTSEVGVTKEIIFFVIW